MMAEALLAVIGVGSTRARHLDPSIEPLFCDHGSESPSPIRPPASRG